MKYKMQSFDCLRSREIKKQQTRDVVTTQQFRMIIRKSLEQSNSNQQKSVEHRICKRNEMVGTGSL